MQPSPTQARLRALDLQTHLVPELRSFYADTLGLPVVAETPETVVFQAGGTRLTFEQVNDSTQPYYHLAFNIPENKLGSAKDWLEQRVSLLRHAETGEDVIFFERWNAHALFF